MLGVQTCTAAPSFYVGIGIRTQNLMFVQQILYPTSHLPSPHLSWDGNLSVAPGVTEVANPQFPITSPQLGTDTQEGQKWDVGHGLLWRLLLTLQV